MITSTTFNMNSLWGVWEFGEFGEFGELGSLGVWEFRSLDNSHARLWPLPKVIIPLSSQFSALNLSRVYCKVTHFSGDMQAFSALFSGCGKVFVFLDICPQITQIYTDFIILNSQSHTDATDFHRFFLQLQG